MNGYQALLEKIASLQSQQFKIRQQGDVLLDCWIAQSKPSGTARTDSPHWQLRSRNPQFGGRKSKYLKPSEVGQYEEAIARGKELNRLEREIEALQEKLERIERSLFSLNTISNPTFRDFSRLREIRLPPDQAS